MQTIKLLAIYGLFIPIVLSLLVFFAYDFYVRSLIALFLGPKRGLPGNLIVKRLIIESFCVIALVAITVITFYAPEWLDKQSAEVFMSFSTAFRWSMNGFAIVIPALVLLLFRAGFVSVLEEEKEGPKPAPSLPKKPLEKLAPTLPVSGNWQAAYISSKGELIKIGNAPPRGMTDGQWARLDFLIEANTSGYLSFTDCRVTDPVTNQGIILNSVQKHEITKYLADDYSWKHHWRRASESVRKMFSYAQEPKPCGENHEWDGCVCKRCGISRSHEWGEIKEHDVSSLEVFDKHGEAKTWFIKTCKNCNHEEVVRTVYK